MLHLPTGKKADAVSLFRGSKLTRDEAIHAMLQIFTRIGEEFEHAELDVSQSPARPPLS